MKRALTPLALVSLALGGAAGAQALGGSVSVEVHFQRQNLPRDTHVAATARCNRGTQVASGGFAAPDRVYAGGGPYTDILSAERRSKREFVVRAENFSSTKGTVYSYAYCADLGPITIADASKTLEGRRSGIATARCPEGLTAVSGGFTGKSLKGGRPEMVPYLSKRSGTNGWKAGAENGAFNGSAKLIVSAYCADLASAPEVEVNDVRVQDLSMPSAGASCRGGEQAIAGGFDAATRHGYAAGASVFSSHRKQGGARWKIEMINGGRDRHLRVYAYCI